MRSRCSGLLGWVALALMVPGAGAQVPRVGAILEYPLGMGMLDFYERLRHDYPACNVTRDSAESFILEECKTANAGSGEVGSVTDTITGWGAMKAPFVVTSITFERKYPQPAPGSRANYRMADVIAALRQKYGEPTKVKREEKPSTGYATNNSAYSSKNVVVNMVWTDESVGDLFSRFDDTCQASGPVSLWALILGTESTETKPANDAFMYTVVLTMCYRPPRKAPPPSTPAPVKNVDPRKF